MSKTLHHAQTLGLGPAKGIQRAALATLCALALAVAPVLTPLAWAGPDANKDVKTTAHVDSPHAFWEDGNFVLRSHTGNYPFKRIEDTVNWIGKGWYYGKQNTYIFRVPENETYRFLGKPGTLLYRAPQLPDMNTYAPIWLGMGADRDIPTDNFRDQNFTLDLLGVNGPGKVEFFGSGDATYAYRMLSSHDPKYRSYWMTAGTHTHNDTTFTKPGRYEITYRVSARTTAGQLIQSPPQTMSYQVGGTNPAGSIPNVVDAYNQSNDTNQEGAGTPTFKLSPYQGPNDGDNLLTALKFETGNPADNGTAVFTIDGFHLAEVPVIEGSAIWPEMIGDETSIFQAMYIPTSGPTARWLSEPVSYQREQGEKSTTTPSTTLVSPHTTAPQPEFPLTTHELPKQQVTVDIQKMDSDGKLKVTVNSSDKTLSARVHGGSYYADEDSPSCEINTTLGQGEASYLTGFDFCKESNGDQSAYTFKLLVSPHPMLGGKSASITIKNFDPARNYHETLTLGADATNPDGAAVTPASPSSPDASGATGKDTHTGTCTEAHKCVFSKGHTDIFYATAPDENTLHLGLKEDITDSGVTQDPGAVILSVARFAWTDLTKNIDGIKQSTYALPMNQDQRLLWPGWETGPVKANGFGALDIHLDQVTGPDGAQVYAFTQTPLAAEMKPLTQAGNLEIRSGDVIHVPQPSHAHLYWAFTQKGIYQMKVHLSGQNAAGKTVESNAATYTWYVDTTYQQPTPGNLSGIVADSGSQGVTPAGVSQPIAPAAPTSPALIVPPTQQAKEECLPVTNRREATAAEVTQAKQNGATLIPSLKDDRKQPAAWVNPESLTFGLGSAAIANAPQGIEFIAPAGQKIWMIGSTQVNGVPWLGANTQHESIVGGVPAGVKWTLNSVNGPGKLAVFESGNFGTVVGKRWFDNVGGPRSVEIPHNTHVHPNWVFTKPGSYAVSLTQSATTKDGKTVSANTTLHFNVGGSGNADNGHFDLGSKLGEGNLGPGKRLIQEGGKYYLEEVVGRTPSGKECQLSLAATGASASLSVLLIVTLGSIALGSGLIAIRRTKGLDA